MLASICALDLPARTAVAGAAGGAEPVAAAVSDRTGVPSRSPRSRRRDDGEFKPGGAELVAAAAAVAGCFFGGTVSLECDCDGVTREPTGERVPGAIMADESAGPNICLT